MRVLGSGGLVAGFRGDREGVSGALAAFLVCRLYYRLTILHRKYFRIQP